MTTCWTGGLFKTFIF